MTTSALRTPAGEQGRGDAPGGDRPERIRRLLASGASAACMAAGLGLVVVTMLVLAGWIAAPHFGLGLIGVVRTATVLWLVGHHVTVHVSGAGEIGMLPLGLVALPGTLLWRAGRAIVRGHQVTSLREAVAAALAVAVPYAALAGALAVASRSNLAAASIPQALLASFAIAFVAAGFGAARALAPWAQLGALVSARTRSVLSGAAGALAVLIAAGAMATALALAGDVHRFSDVYRTLDPGLVGAGLLLLAQFAYLPNAVLWAVAYMLGPGFAVGAGTVAAPTGSVLGPMPAFPLLAALPAGAHGSGPGWLGAVMLAFPYLAGAFGGLLVVRIAPTTVLESAPMRGFCCGLLTGLTLGIGAAFAGGPLGDGRMAAVGPSPWQVAAVASLEVGIAAAVTAGLVNWWCVRKRWPGLAGHGSGAAIQPDRRATPSRPSHQASPWGSDRIADADDDYGHVIYLNRWASDGDGDDGKPPPGRRSRGPSALP
ncbi:MAG: cell division protein PerM [Streptosporangiaceae bacterium]